MTDSLLLDLAGARVTIGQEERPDTLGLQQVHGNRVLLRRTLTTDLPQADGHWTDKRGVPLYVRTADCLPVVVVAPNRAVAAIHAGWRGVLSGILPELYRQWHAAKIDLAHVHWLIGPHICADCFAMRRPEVEAFLAEPYRANEVTGSGEEFFINLPGVLLADLRRAGYPDPVENRLVGGCTFHQDLWPGYRRQQGIEQRIYTTVQL